MARRSRGRAAPQARQGAEASAGQALLLHGAALRAQELQAERERLLREVQRKKRELEALRLKLERKAHEAFEQMADLFVRHDQVVRKLRDLFSELLAPGRLSKRAARVVARVRRLFERLGMLSLLEDEEGRNPEQGQARENGRGSRRGDGPGRARGDGPGRAREDGRERAREADGAGRAEVASAAQPERERRSLRDIFRNLARAVHPDRAGEDDERARRTELMKEVTRAYQAGDLARLLELESRWQDEQGVGASGDPAQRCDALERVNRELEAQARELTRTLRHLKRDARRASTGLLGPEMVERARAELDELAKVCEFVRRFRDGHMTLAEFERGPAHVRGAELLVDGLDELEDLDELDELEAVLERVLSEQLEAEARQKPQRGGRGRGRGRG